MKQQALNEFAVRGNLNANNWRITSLARPVNAGDAVSKSYVDAVQSGLTIREPVKVVTPETAGNISLTGTVTELDGITLAPGDRVLVKHQSNASRNGIYVVNLGSPWVRSADADSSGELRNGVCVTATHGSVGVNTSWVLVNAGNVVLNSTPINFVYFTTQLGAGPPGTGLVVVNDGSFGTPLPLTSFASAEHTHTTFSENPPLTPKQGDRWIDSITLRAYERLNSSWVETVTG